ncbi:22476_t:CDS:2, partial [Cetraspora pellucida]
GWFTGFKKQHRLHQFKQEGESASMPSSEEIKRDWLEESIEEKITYTEAENYVNKMLKFLYEQDPKFGKVKEEVRILRKLYKRV